MPYYIRPMRKEDIGQVNEIDREAFPTQLPPPNYHHELENKLARYIVVCDGDKHVKESAVKSPPEKDTTGVASRLRQLLSYAHLFDNKKTRKTGDYVSAFAGIWVMVDEAHITNIAVRESCRRQGIGELLLISIIDLAGELKASFVTLEVRASNTTAQNLYRKYGFTEVGVRRGYYIDNREDGLIMSTESINSPSFQEHINQLKRTLIEKYGICKIL